MSKGQICSVIECKTITRYGDICDKHRYRMKVFNSYELPKIYPLCKVDGCEKSKDGKYNLCGMHRSRMSRHKSIHLPEKIPLPDGIAYICDHHGEISFNEAYKNPKDGYYSCQKCRRMSKEKIYLN